jgi:hypothetical protein
MPKTSVTIRAAAPPREQSPASFSKRIGSAAFLIAGTGGFKSCDFFRNSALLFGVVRGAGGVSRFGQLAQYAVPLRYNSGNSKKHSIHAGLAGCRYSFPALRRVVLRAKSYPEMCRRHINGNIFRPAFTGKGD